MMKNQMGSSRLDTVLKMLLIAFISLLAFSSGVYFGKQMSDSDYQLKAFESDFNKSKTTAENSKDDTLVDEEVAAVADKLINEEKEAMNDHGDEHGAKKEERAVASVTGHGETHEEPAHKAPAGKAAHAEPAHKEAAHGTKNSEHEEPTKPTAKASGHGKSAMTGSEKKSGEAEHSNVDLTGVHKAAQRVASNHAPTETPKAKVESRTPQSLPQTVGPATDMEYTVQIASYPTAEDAKAHAAELMKKGFPAFSVEAKIKGQVWYRVSVGSFSSQKEATQYRAQLVKQADLQTAIVQRIERH